jgi:integrase
MNKVEPIRDKSKIAELKKILRQQLKDYIQEMEAHEYLFQSRIGKNKPLSRFQAYRILSSAGRRVGLDSIGCHSTRKTFGYHHYKKNKDVALLQKLFNHSSPSITLDYIGITQDIMDKSIEKFSL